MPTSLPTAFNGKAQAQYPFVKRIIFDTAISFNADSSERRWKRRAPFWEFEWTWSDLVKSDAQALVGSFNSQFGMYGSNWQFALGGSTFANLALTTDTIEVLQRGPFEHDAKFTARQVQNRGWVPPTRGNTDWPSFSSGAYLQYPYRSQYRNLTTVGDSPTGTRYAFPWWGSGLTGFPSGPLRRFPLSMTLPDADAATLENFFLWAQGRLTNFNFTDPFQALSYYKIRFDSDTLELRYLDINQVQANVTLIETN